jgi:hypothetical protein
MFNTCGYSASAPGYVGTTFTPPFYVDVTSTYGTAGGNYTTYESDPTYWLLSSRVLASGTISSNLYATEINGFESAYGQSDINSATLDGDGHYYWSGGQGAGVINYSWSVGIGSSPRGALVMPPLSAGGGAQNTGILEYTGNEVVNSTLTFGPLTAPSSNGSPNGQPVNTYPTMGTDTYCLMMDASANWPMTVTKVVVWQAPTPALAGPGRLRP